MNDFILLFKRILGHFQAPKIIKLTYKLRVADHILSLEINEMEGSFKIQIFAMHCAVAMNYYNT